MCKDSHRFIICHLVKQNQHFFSSFFRRDSIVSIAVSILVNCCPPSTLKPIPKNDKSILAFANKTCVSGKLYNFAASCSNKSSSGFNSTTTHFLSSVNSFAILVIKTVFPAPLTPVIMYIVQFAGSDEKLSTTSLVCSNLEIYVNGYFPNDNVNGLVILNSFSYFFYNFL